MNRKGPNKKILLLVIGILILCCSGCGEKTKHKILTFFFTGVPTLEEMERQEKEAEEKFKKKEDNKKPSASEVANRSGVPSKEKKVSPSPKKLYSHTPYADGRCKECHRASTSFTMFRSKKSTSTFLKGGGIPGVLIAPRKKLCIKCHEHLSPNEASLSGLWLHTTAAEGDCDACHGTHQSEYPGILLGKPEEICQECHSGEKTMHIPEHRKPGECLDCHNPHLGKNKLLLKKDYQEEKYPVKQSLYSRNSKPLPDTKGKGIDPQNETETLKKGNQDGLGK